MAQASFIEHRVRKIHEILTETGWVGLKMPRDLFETALAMHMGGVSGEQARRYIVAGEAFGLWRRSERSRVLRVLPARQEETTDPCPVLA
jgi:hypothetical protein